MRGVETKELLQLLSAYCSITNLNEPMRSHTHIQASHTHTHTHNHTHTHTHTHTYTHTHTHTQGLTLAKADAQMASTGMKANSSRATFQLDTKEMTRPPKKVDTNCMKRDILSPMPSWILSKSLHEVGMCGRHMRVTAKVKGKE